MPEVFSWNPVRPGLVRRELRVPRFAFRAHNFGDLLVVPLIERLLAERGLRSPSDDGPLLLTIGSVLHFAEGRTVVWGSGVNPKIDSRRYRRASFDVRAVRGPITAEFLQRMGVEVPEVHGDPGLLVGHLFPELRAAASGPAVHPVTYVPNLNERWRADAEHVPVAYRLDPRDDVQHVLSRIARSGFVVGSSLHAVIVAESLGVPARLLRPIVEHELKYVDYLRGSGRSDVRLAADLAEALRLGGMQPPEVDFDRLRSAFPSDLWMPLADSAA